MPRFVLRNIYLLPLLLCPLTAMAQFDQCDIDAPAAVYGAQSWFEMARPLNVTIERLGRLPDSAGGKLVTLAYQGWQQGKTEQQINTEVTTLCKTFSVHALLADIAESPWPAERTICSDSSDNIVTILNEAGGNRATAARVMLQLIGEEPAPKLLQLVEQAIALKQQNTADIQIMQQLYDSCAAKDITYKKALGKEFYHE